MTALDYTAFAARIAAVLARLGQTATLRRLTIGGSATSPTAATPGETTFSITCAIVPMPGRNVGLGVGDTNIRETDVEIYLTGMEPRAGDRIEAINGTFTVLTCQIVAPAGVAVVYQVWGRKYG